MDFIIQNQLAIYPELGLAHYPITADPHKVYGDAYFERYRLYEVHADHHQTTVKINTFRKDLVNKYTKGEVIDVGCGAGTFIKMRNLQATNPCKTWGYDINPKTVRWLKRSEVYMDPYDLEVRSIPAISMWDCLEHIPEPSPLFSRVMPGGYVFLTVPLFKSLDPEEIKKSKHFKPQEHCWYFTRQGIQNMLHGFELVEETTEEEAMGREGVSSFVFRKRS